MGNDPSEVVKRPVTLPKRLYLTNTSFLFLIQFHKLLAAQTWREAFFLTNISTEFHSELLDLFPADDARGVTEKVRVIRIKGRASLAGHIEITRRAGQGGHVGDGSGCTWRQIAMNKMINASCMYRQIDAHVEASDTKNCFTECPQPKNLTSDCYLKCYSETTATMSNEELVVPWTKAFASEDTESGGCPSVKTILEELDKPN